MVPIDRRPAAGHDCAMDRFVLPLGSPLADGFDPFLVLLLALGLDAVAGEMRPLFRHVPHPVVAIGTAIAWAERRLNRPQRGPRARKVRGILLLAALCAVTGGAGVVIQAVAARAPYGWALEAVILSTLIAQRSLYDHVKAVADGLRDGGLRGGRTAVAMIVGRDPERLDGAGVGRAAIESCAENFSDGIVAPVVWYVVAGLPGILVYKTVNTLDSMIGHRSQRYRDFGWASARFDDLMNLVPARLSGLLLAGAALLTPGARPGAAVATMLRDAGKHRSPNAGWPEAATAGALGLALAGPRHYPDETVDDPWVGDGRPQATEADIRRALRLMVTACGLCAGLAVLLWLAV